MTDLQADVLTADQIGIKQAAKILGEGGLVAFPTETVYGLGADACNGIAVARVYTAKGRPSFNPLIVHVADLDHAKLYAEFNDTALKLASAFWPGPLTLVLPCAPDSPLSELVTAGLNSVAIRIPAHPVAQALLQEFDGPLAAPSANPSGRISPTQAVHVITDMRDKIEAIIDGGACVVGLESTILKIEGHHVSILRAGGLSGEQIEQALGKPIARPSDPKTPQSPGQLQSHYAPNSPVRLNVKTLQDTEILLGFGPECKEATLNLSPTGDLTEAAANLFSYLRKMDAISEGTIAISPIPMSGLGVAINDRLKRAAAPRN